MNSSTQNTRTYEKVSIEKWGPDEFNECRAFAISGRPACTDEAQRWLRAKMHLVWAYRSGYGTEPDSRRYFDILAQLAELESADKLGVKWLLAQAFKEGIGTLRNEKSYVTWMERAAQDRDPEAMFSLAEAYRSGGEGVERDENQYFYWRRQMAKEGLPFALMEMAQAYKTGDGMPQSDDQFFKNATKAMKLAEEAISGTIEDDGDFTSEDLPQAIQLVAQAHRDGTGTTKSKTKYFCYLSKAMTAVNNAVRREKNKDRSRVEEVQSSLASIVYEFAMAHLQGYGTTENSRTAVKYMKQAAEAGDLKAMLQLANCFETGVGIRKNRAKALQWRKKAAAKDDPDAMYETAIAYGTGKGTKGDPRAFRRWARDAVRAGHNKAFIALGLAELYDKGLITPGKIRNVLHSLDNLRHEVQKIKSDHKLSARETGEGVAHFTTLETLHSMLPSERTASYSSRRGTSHFLRLYNISYVNDPQEGQILLLGENDDAITMQEFFPHSLPAAYGTDDRQISETGPLSGLAFSVYVGSFTLESDRLDLWRAYGRDGTGFCIVTPVHSFLQRVGASDQAFAGLAASETDNLDADLTLYRVEYGRDKIDSTRARLGKHLKEIAKARDRVAPGGTAKDVVKKEFDLTVRAILSDILYLYKHREYKRENEVRMLAPFAISASAVCADERSPARLFVRTKPFLFCQGSQIIIGPKVCDKEEVRLELKHRLDRNGHSNVDVIMSEIRYR